MAGISNWVVRRRAARYYADRFPKVPARTITGEPLCEAWAFPLPIAEAARGSHGLITQIECSLCGWRTPRRDYNTANQMRRRLWQRHLDSKHPPQ